MWIFPFAATPSIRSGIVFETNGFEDPSISWPPPDPDRIVRRPTGVAESPAFTFTEGDAEEERVAAFRRRQQEDLRRWQGNDGGVHKRRAFHRRFDADAELLDDDVAGDDESGEEGWRNHEGERLNDFGVDEDVEFYDEEDVPLAKLIQRRKAGP